MKRTTAFTILLNTHDYVWNNEYSPRVNAGEFSSVTRRVMVKIIFLDFDGVLRTYSACMAPGPAEQKVDARCVAALNRVTEETKARIVVSSSWRGRYIATMQRLLKTWGVTGKVIGVTPRLERKQNGIYIGVQRGNEIQAWLDSYSKLVDAFVILDDDTDMVYLSNRQIQTEFYSGLTLEHATEAIRLLSDCSLTTIISIAPSMGAASFGGDR